ncbi:Clp protease N-terminal domain-containing protein, partial [Patescibacteria group bacterium]
MNKKILDKFSAHLKQAFRQANAVSTELGHGSVNPEHMLFGLIMQRGSIAAEVLTKVGLTNEKIRRLITQQNSAALPAHEKPQEKINRKLSIESKKAIEKAALLAHQHKHKYIGTEHLLFTILQLDTKALNSLYQAHAINKKNVIEHLQTVMKTTSRFPDLTQLFDQPK